MKRSELYYRKPQSESYAPRHRTDQPKPSGSLSDEAEKRIVMLYTSGQSVEAITREVGRARHLVVHILQAKGVFGSSQKESICQEPGKESLAVEEMEGGPAIEELEPKPLAVTGSDSVITVEEPSRKLKLPTKPESPPQLKSMATEEPRPTPLAVEKPQHTSHWSPIVVHGLCRVIMQFNLYPDMSPEDMHNMVSDWNLQVGS